MQNVVIVMARCQSRKSPFGMRFEQHASDNWQVTWSFPLKEATAKREGYEENTINGQIVFNEKFPGCPYCEQGGAFLCGCGRLNCHDGSETGHCSWCGTQAELGGTVTSLTANSGF